VENFPHDEVSGKTREILGKKAGIYGYSRFGRSVSRRNYKRNRDDLKSGVGYSVVL
jgi:hypothetical protein